jgi:transcription-repair coupling factor (superfamily II helicase)
MTSELHSLLDALTALDPISELIDRLSNGSPASLQVAPLIAAARPALTSAVARRLPAPIVYVVQTSEAALRAHEDLAVWLDPEQVMLFPAADSLPYEHMSPAADLVVGRLRVLRRLADGAAPPVIVAPVKALTQPTLSRADLAAATMRLARGDELNLDQLFARWVTMGYRVAPTVEEPGEINRRGGIVDIFPPSDDMPLRIEFFGDEIDSLRRFDPITQRSEAQLRDAVVGPPQEFALWRTELALERLRAIDTGRLRREALAEWALAIERIEAGERFDGRALFTPFFRTKLAIEDPGSTLFAHLPANAVVFLNDPQMLAQHVAELDRQAEERRMLQVESGELPERFPRPYLRWDEVLSAARGVRLVGLSNNPVEGGVSADAPAGALPHALPEATFMIADLFGGQLRRLVDDIVARLRDGEQVLVVSPQAARIEEMVGEALAHAEEGGAALRPLLTMVHGSLDAGMRIPALNQTLYTDTEIFGWRPRRAMAERRRRRDRSAEERAAFLRGLKQGDYVVHIEHGIAVYEGLVRRTVGSIEREYLNLRYADGDRLYVPVDQIDRVSRYIGAGDAEPQLTRLGTQEWERAKRKARAAVQDLADELIKLYAQRQMSEGHAFSPDNEWQRELEASFPYVETPDQLQALIDVKHDMEQLQPMDRLICGDVGFGKTEVALRAAFKAIQDGKQVAVLVPTTVLAQQHYDTFSRRMAAFPVKVDMISRFRSAREQADITQRLLRGEIDIIIGTHRLLSKDIVFKNLGLLVIDEEQRFGVRHKERIKQLRANIDVLTLTATPIPRTLHMAMAGIRDLSVIDTPPEDRLPIKTYVQPYEDALVREAILRELERDGQIYFVHNRVHDIYYVADRLQRLVPEAEVAVGHGQLEERQLERVMLEFFSGKDDVLVCTTIIESGLDVPNANTIIIDDATNYGLAQLYQLRGRVGRSAQRAYAYLFYRADKPMTPEAHERLQAIQEATELGAGFRIAMRDLEIRGAGNLLGAEQSGHIAAVGFDLYSRLLEQAVKRLKEQFDAVGSQPAPTAEALVSGAAPHRKQPPVKVDEKVLISPLVTIDLPLDAYLPVEYIPDDRVRLSVYQTMATAQTPREVRALRQELKDRFGALPAPADALLTWLLVKALALAVGVTSVVTSEEEFIVRIPDGSALDREKLRRRFGRDPAVRVGPQFVRLDRRTLNMHGDTKWIEMLIGVLETLGK